ncbi:AMP-binding protein [Mycolicibacterium sp.]|uniref:AMP-binding protein n=1 Tax=Mycolicibacterium sp. TaxID=2320850 RepID=UPI003D142D2A
MVATSGSPLLVLLRERASLQPNDAAFTFVDYEQDWDGVAATLTWAQLYRRAQNLARELEGRSSPGDRAVISAPQGLDYIVAFVGALEAGLIAVPLSVPTAGIHDERVTAVLRDAAPSVILTTSAVRAEVVPYAESVPVAPGPSVVDVDVAGPDIPAAAGRQRPPGPEIAYLQYTSGSTRTPAGVMVSHRNLAANWAQMMAGLFPDYRLPGTIVTWLPFYHDMGLLAGLCGGIMGGFPTVVTSPLSFLQRPARWLHLLAGHPQVFSAAPNFAFELAAARTSDDDMAGLDLGDVLYIMSGAERVNPITTSRFAQRFARFNLAESVLRPAYGLAEAVLYVATHAPGGPPEFVGFETEKLAAGHAKRSDAGTPLVSYGVPQEPTVRIVDPDTAMETAAGSIGEIWVHGDNVSPGYWGREAETGRTFDATLAAPSPGTPQRGWLRTGDLGFISERELFIVGRIKDLLIVRGRNHYPDDIEGTVQEISRGRVAAIAVPGEATEKVVLIVEFRHRGQTPEEAAENLRAVEERIVAAVSNVHGVAVEDVVLVAPGSVPITTSGKVRRASCVENYRNGAFRRLGA